MRFLVATALALAAFLLAQPNPAYAGGCAMCTSDNDCAGGVCVVWDRDFGCGDQRLSCCPGQACALNGGVPSCLGNGCVPLSALLDAGFVLDGGETDGGASADAGDGDGGGLDTGLRDTGTSTRPSKPGDPPTRSSCGCRATTPERSTAWPLLVLGVLWTIERASRRRAV